MGTQEKTAIFITLVIILSVFIFLAWYFSHRARHKETLLMIEKGIDVQKAKDGKESKFPWLKSGIVLLGTSFGLIIIAILAKNDLLNGSGTLPLSILGISAGISLLVAHSVGQKKAN